MTLYAVISDIHANIEALNAVKDDAERIATRFKEELRYICLGDVVDYGPHPNECMEWIFDKQEKGLIEIIQGNHDDEASAEEVTRQPLRVGSDYWPITFWTRQTLISEHKSNMRKWSKEKHLELMNLTLLHSSLAIPDDSIKDFHIAEANFLYLKTKYGLFGHSHYQGCFVLERDSHFSEVARQYLAIPKDDKTKKFFKNTGELGDKNNSWQAFPILEKDKVDKEDLHLMKGEKMLINPGSVGQPRRPQIWNTPDEISVLQHDARAAYVLLHINVSGSPRFAFRRKKYDTDKVKNDLRKLRWQADDHHANEGSMEEFCRLIKNSYEQKYGRDKYQQDAVDILNGKPIYYKDFGHPNEFVAKLNIITQSLIEERLIKHFN